MDRTSVPKRSGQRAAAGKATRKIARKIVGVQARATAVAYDGSQILCRGEAIKMGCLLIGLVAAIVAGIASLIAGHSVITALVFYSAAGQLAMLTVAGATYVINNRL